MDLLNQAIIIRNRGGADVKDGTAGPIGPQGPQGPAGEYAVDIDGGMANTVYGGIDPIIAGGAS